MSGRGIVSREEKFGGDPFLEDTRIRVSDIAVKYEWLGYSVDELLEAYPELERSDVHEALAYFYSNEESISIQLEGSPGAKPA